MWSTPGKDLDTVSLKDFRLALEQHLDLKPGSLESRKEEINELVKAEIGHPEEKPRTCVHPIEFAKASCVQISHRNLRDPQQSHCRIVLFCIAQVLLARRTQAAARTKRKAAQVDWRRSVRRSEKVTQASEEKVEGEDPLDQESVRMFFLSNLLMLFLSTTESILVLTNMLSSPVFLCNCRIRASPTARPARLKTCTFRVR